MVRDIREWIGGYKGTYVDREGNVRRVTGTFALGPRLSWYDETGNYVVVDGVDQKRLVRPEPVYTPIESGAVNDEAVF